MTESDENDSAELTLDEARKDAAQEFSRLTQLDAKLAILVSFSGVSLTLVAGIGTQLIVAHKLYRGLTGVVGGLLVLATSALLYAVIAGLEGLVPQPSPELSDAAAAERATGEKLARSSSEAAGQFVATIYKKVLPGFRKANNDKVFFVQRAAVAVAVGLLLVVTAVLIVVVGSVAGATR